MQVKDIMYVTLYRIDGEKTVQEAAQELKKQTIGSLLVTSDHLDVGIITDRDIVRKVVAIGKDPAKTKVRDVMSSSLVTVGKDKDLKDVLDLFIQHNIKRVPVVFAGEVVGIVSTRIVAKYVREYFRNNSDE